MKGAFFQQLLDAWYDPLYRFALSLCRNRDEAQDLTQQTFARWAEKGHGLRDSSKAKSWLFTVLYREYLRVRRLHLRESPPDDEGYFETMPSDERTSQQIIDGHQVISALKRIEPTFRAPLTLFYLESHSYREIAEILDIPIGTVMSRISRGKEQLRQLLQVQPVAEPARIIPLRSMKGPKHG